MAKNYKIVKDELFNSEIVQYEENGVLYSIPTDPANSDYQRYLRWLENPNEEDNGGLN